MLDDKGNIFGFTKYKVDENGLIIERISEYKNRDLKTIVINKYNQNGLLIKQISSYDMRPVNERNTPIPNNQTTVIAFEYLEFDDRENWTKRKEIKVNQDTLTEFSYQTYEYYK